MARTKIADINKLRYADTTAKKSQAAVSKVTSGPTTGARRGKRKARVVVPNRKTELNNYLSGMVNAKGNEPRKRSTVTGSKEQPV